MYVFIEVDDSNENKQQTRTISFEFAVYFEVDWKHFFKINKKRKGKTVIKRKKWCWALLFVSFPAGYTIMHKINWKMLIVIYHMYVCDGLELK